VLKSGAALINDELEPLDTAALDSEISVELADELGKDALLGATELGAAGDELDAGVLDRGVLDTGVLDADLATEAELAPVFLEDPPQALSKAESKTATSRWIFMVLSQL
jgi:hypothetical protein